VLNILKRQIAEVPNVTQINDVKDHDSVVKKVAEFSEMPCVGLKQV
jgi:hypothetical protein